MELPGVDAGLQLFGDNGYLQDIAKELATLRVAQSESTVVDDGCFVSGLGVRHKWSCPLDIGEITVGPYVVDMDIMSDL